MKHHTQNIHSFTDAWDSFFFGDAPVSDDFLAERAEQHQSEREVFYSH